MFGLEECPVFYPTEEEFKDPMGYIALIGEEGKGKEFGICKIVPPEGWKMPFVLDTEVGFLISSDHLISVVCPPSRSSFASVQ